jgi:DNA-binding IclR family transcriptional regulator
MSQGGVDEDVTGVAAPLFNAEGLVIGCLSLVFTSHSAADMLRDAPPGRES